jgi:hypothetical protein
VLPRAQPGTMIFRLGVIAIVAAHGPLAVRMTLTLLMGVCSLAGFGLVAMGAMKITSRAEDQRLMAQDHARTLRDAEGD